MGFFRDSRNYSAHKNIGNNGLSEGSPGVVCEYCQYRMVDPRVSYLACSVHKMHVGAGQVCGEFTRGDPLYELN
jgi:hypothetical protein